MTRRLLFLLLILMTSSKVSAQNGLRGTVLNAYTGAPVAGAAISISEPAVQLFTDSNGQFQLTVPETIETLLITIKALGIDTSFEVFPQSAGLFQLQVIPKDFDLPGTTIRGLTARQVVLKAIEALPQNYPDSNYVYYGHYRQYQQRGEHFQNLVEAQIAAAILPGKVHTKLTADLSFAILRSRKQGIAPTKIEDVDIREGLSEQLFEEDPVYFLQNSSLAGRVLEGSQFRFDSTYSGPDEFRIYYTSELSSEDHGFSQKFATHSVYRESLETGMLVIDRKSFAFKRISRKVRRLPGFDYYHMNNWVPTSRKLSRELVNGQLDVQYVQLGEKWFLSQIAHGYSNDYFSHNFRDYDRLAPGMQLKGRLGEFFEWQTASVSRHIPGELANAFQSKPYVQLTPAVETGFVLSHKEFPFLFFSENVIQNALLSTSK